MIAGRLGQLSVSRAAAAAATPLVESAPCIKKQRAGSKTSSRSFSVITCVGSAPCSEASVMSQNSTTYWRPVFKHIIL